MSDAPRPFGPVPSSRQLEWHGREFYGFVHFTTNTFTDKEWGYGDESPDVFAPTAFDADQIAGVAARAGMSGLILTCKHHDGFCLWPTRYTEHSVKKCEWRSGRGDVVREMSEACARHGIAFGVYLSPWDRNRADYGSPAYVEYFRNQLRELTTEYGELFEVWFDGANGGDGFYGGARETRTIDRRTYYDWENTRRIVRENQPGAVMFSDAGPDVRWVGNERGVAGDPCWSTLNPALLYPGIQKDEFKTRLTGDVVAAWDSPRDMLNSGDPGGDSWLPAECDVSIRPGWFYHASEDERVKGPLELLDLYYKSVGRGASLLLNLPPDRRGVIHEADAEGLSGFRELLDGIFGRDLAPGAKCGASSTRGEDETFAPSNVVDGSPDTYWSTDERAAAPELVMEFPREVTFNVVGLREHLPLGQRVRRFAMDVDRGGEWAEWSGAESIGNRRLVRGPTRTTTRLRLRIVECPVPPAISGVAVHLDGASEAEPRA